jgi:hypothetical protein
VGGISVDNKGDIDLDKDSDSERDEIQNDEVTQAPIKVAKDPGAPTPEEIAEHDPTHLPYRSWCPVCVEACGKEDAHYSKKGTEEDGRPVVALDYGG